MAKAAKSAIQELEIGPFAGGINTYSDPAMIADDEMVDCVNFDLSLDGSLVSRPPWNTLHAQKFTSTDSNPNHPESYQLVIGTGTYETNRYVIVTSNHTGAAASYIYFVDGVNAGLIAKLGDGYHSKSHRYADDIYLVPDIKNGGKGLKYNLGTGLTTIVPNMPEGYASIIYKDRLWISGRRAVIPGTTNSRLFFSELADFTNWPGTNFFDINPGDGDAVNELVVYQDNIIIFKDNATYVLAYDTGPAQAVLQVINTDVGAMGPRCVDVYENSIFVLKYNQLYEMSNYDFVRVSVKIPFEYDDTLPVASNSWKYPFWVRIVGDRAVVRFYNRIYVYHLRLRGWTRWDSEDENIKYLGPIMRLDNTNTTLLRGYDTYIAGSTLAYPTDRQGNGSASNWSMYFKLFKMEDRYELSNTENGNVVPVFPPVDIKLMMKTKQYAIGLSHRFKRLMHWGLNCYTARDVTGTLFPFSVAYKVTWNQLSIYHWHDLNTWEYPLTAIPGTTQEVSGDSGKQVKFIRFPKSLRFRLLQFQVDMATQGNTTDGPAYIYSVTAFVGAKQLMPKAVN
ncbi:hypothetical protein [Streptomyces rochei]|uniref:hypothetical protein n=1 Tax=Streptomyces rochei TaxID=1928 RepID=UPI0036B104A8